MEAAGMRQDLPQGTVTFLFTDIEGSTVLLEEWGRSGTGSCCRSITVCVGWRGWRTAGLRWIRRGMRSSSRSRRRRVRWRPRGRRSWPRGLGLRVRIGVHTGEVSVNETGYVGLEVHRAARIAAAGHGGQVLVSSSTAALVGAEGLRDLGEHRFKDLAAPERVFQMGRASFRR